MKRTLSHPSFPHRSYERVFLEKPGKNLPGRYVESLRTER